MNSMGRSVEGVPERDGRGELRAKRLPRASFPWERLWGFAMMPSSRGKVGEGFDPDASGGKVDIVCENVGGKKVASSVAYPLVALFFSFFSFFWNHASFVSRYKKPYGALAMKRKKPINANPPPASRRHGNNQTPRVHRKSPARLAPKIIYPRHVRKQYIETYR